MELFIFDPKLYQQKYGCSNISVDEIPLGDRVQPINGSIILLFYAIFEPLSILCAISLFRHRQDNSCYLLMFVTALVDTLNLNISGLLTGVLGLFVIVFCQAPTLVYVAGCFAESFWALQADLNMVLALNRCIEYLSPRAAEFLFQGRRTWIWLGVLLAHFCVYVSDVNLIFVPMYFAWFYSPYTGYRDDLDNNYFYPMDMFQNYFAGVSLPAIYAVFAVAYFLKLWALKEYTTITREHKLIFLQIFLISILNLVVVGCFVLMVFGVNASWLTLTEMYSWNLQHGLPSIVYLVLNKTIRTDVTQMIFSILALFGLHFGNKQHKAGAKQSTAVRALGVTSTAPMGGLTGRSKNQENVPPPSILAVVVGTTTTAMPVFSQIKNYSQMSHHQNNNANQRQRKVAWQ